MEEALTMLDGTLAHVERTEEKRYLSEMLRLKGEVLLMGDPSATAASCANDAASG